jgi:hypothetical protein
LTKKKEPRYLVNIELHIEQMLLMMNGRIVKDLEPGCND